jgi:parallel beta-helix repeat protein
MKRAYIFALALVVFANLPVLATIINIPGDYATIQEGIDAAVNGDTVLVQPGTYAENVNFSGHDIVLGSLFLTTGDTTYVEQTIIDGDSSGSVITFESGEESTAIITGFTIQNGHSMDGGGIHCFSSNPTICNNIVNGNSAESDGGGIYCDDSDPVIFSNMISGNTIYDGAGGGIYCWNGSSPAIYGNTISGNSADDGGGICCYLNSDPIISGNIIRFNSAASGGHGGGVYCHDSNPTIINNIIYNNVATSWLEGFGGGICCDNTAGIVINNTLSLNFARYGGGMAIIDGAYPTIANTILWGDTAPFYPEIIVDDISWPTIIYCDVQGGWEGEGNIDTDPLFRYPESGDFHLMFILCGDTLDSPCIDAGDPDILDSLLDCSWGLGTILSDMGAFGGGDSVQVGIDDYLNLIPKRLDLMQNYPNPFNASTVIRYSLPSASDVTISIYDILGRRVETLVQGEQPAGYHRIVWDASDLSSGIYFYRIKTGNYSRTNKMILLR